MAIARGRNTSCLPPPFHHGTDTHDLPGSSFSLFIPSTTMNSLRVILSLLVLFTRCFNGHFFAAQIPTSSTQCLPNKAQCLCKVISQVLPPCRLSPFPIVFPAHFLSLNLANKTKHLRGIRLTPKMCHTVQYLFTRCPVDSDDSFCTGNAGPKHVEVCPLHAHSNPAWSIGYDHFNLPYCTPTLEYIYVDSMCHGHQNYLAVRGEADYFDVFAESHNTFAFGQVPDNRVWHVPQTPWTDLHFREVEWNPILAPFPLIHHV